MAADSSAAELRAQFWAFPQDALCEREMVSAAAWLSVWSLHRMAVNGGGPPFIKVGRRCLYRKGDVLAWIEQRGGRKVTSTAQLAA